MTLQQAVRLWIEEAEHDLQVAEHLYTANCHSNCALSCEQSPERLPKALWIWRNGEGSPRHDRVGELATSSDAPPQVVAAARMLEPDYLTARYPDAALVTPHTRYTAADSEQRLQAARVITAWAREKLGEEGWA